MDAIQPPNRYMGAGPPPIPDPQLQQHHQQQQAPHHHPHWYPPPPPHPPPQFQYQHQPPSYPSPPLPYPAPHPLPHHYAPPPRPPLHMPPPHQQPYPPQPNQPWGNPNWVRHQGWEYPDRNILHNNEEDWAARARAWAAAKAAMENQHPPSQFTPVGRMEEHNHVYHDQYQQTIDPHFTDIQKSSLPLSSPPQLPVSVTNPHRPSVQVLPESMTFGSGPPCYVSDGPVSYSARDGAADMHPISPPQGSVLTSSSIYQQEVPSSYSSMPGHGGSGNQNEKLLMSLPLPMPSYQEAQPHSRLHPLPAIGRSVSVEQPHFMHEDQSAESMTDANDQPSDFEHGPHQPTNYTHPDPAVPIGGVENIASVPSMHSWTPGVTPGAVFPPIPPVPPGPQFDPAFLPPSSGAQIFGRIPGPSFRPGIPPPVGATYGLSAGTALHPPAAFPGDANGVFNVSERPKKASVPNWLREEIIKKSVIASSSIQDHPTEDSFHSIGAGGDDKSLRKGDQADSKSTDSTRLNEDEEDDEDDVEAARSAAINKEIKRILTEVLLKVTDELFDEIATKVLSEDDDLMIEVNNSTDLANQKASSPSHAVPTPKASAKVLIPVKVKIGEIDDATEKSNSSSPGNVLGLANYASDDDEVQSSSMLSTRQINGAAHQRSGDARILGVVPKAEEKGTSPEHPSVGQRDVQSDTNRANTNGSLQNSSSDMTRKASPCADSEFIYDDGGSSAARGGASGIPRDQSPIEAVKVVGFSHGHTDAIESKDDVKRKDCMKSELECGNIVSEKSMVGGSHVREARSRSDKDDRHEGKQILASKDFVEGADAVEIKANHKHSASGVSRREEGRDLRKDKGANERNSGSKERGKDRGSLPGEKGRASESRKSSTHAESKDDKKETEKVKRVSAKEDSNRKRERRRDEMEDRSRHRDARDSHRYKRRRSSSDGSKGKDSKDNSVVSHASGSDDEASENSRHRKLRSNRRSLSPSPTRSRKRQVSRSPHSKHSQRRHSPYSSLEARGRRSRSGTPIRRRR
ncbi:uncharacterized protein LOC131252967 isoform X2 [Magnolia sinica]|uniref:uncharacterized protein LOC131252967 isoform X2 n=1 Tax=Magnolia sinica TaxID=86752 RepID=UPI0026588A00|nr:uncharacterized protein LOC131252967 isoform X2 [Magnolia sinica]